jgi:crotonobetainyl-CoA:carnitine CoA-transferase CaiB-like acyl-CoA transferase
LLHQRAKSTPTKTAPGVFMEVALSDAAAYLALPRTWGMTLPAGSVGGSHAGYKVYACKDGRVALAALEPHFAAALCVAAGLGVPNRKTMAEAETHQKIARFLRRQTCAELARLGAEKDIPLHVMPT